MNLRARIWLLPLCAATVFTIGCAASYFAGSRTSATAERLRVQDYPALEAVGAVEQSVASFKGALQAAATEGDVSRTPELEQLARDTLLATDKLGRIGQQAGGAAKLRAAASAYQQAGLEVIQAMLDKKDPAPEIALMQTHLGALDQAIASAKAGSTQAVAQTQAEITHGIGQLLGMLLGTCAAALVALGLASRLVVTSVWRDLGDEPSRLGQAMQQIAAGDLRPADAPAAAALPNSVTAALGGMTARLRETVGVIRQATTFIAGAASEIAAGNQDLSQRTEQAASHLQRTASALEQVTGTVGQTAAASSQARELAGDAVAAAQRGGEIVSQVVANMDEINAASQRINDITGVIDGLAFQTNILALNAAVEAARAGEQGRGFAVVASEVRSLAQRSAQAAKEIKQLIGMSSEKVASGTRLVAGAGDTMADIVQGVQRVTTMIAEMSDATLQQSTGITEVNRSVAELDRMTQQNAALVEQSAAAAAHLRAQAERLADSVAVFQMEESPSLPTQAVHESPSEAPSMAREP